MASDTKYLLYQNSNKQVIIKLESYTTQRETNETKAPDTCIKSYFNILHIIICLLNMPTSLYTVFVADAHLAEGLILCTEPNANKKQSL
jgi:hypothetical protein